MEDPSSVSFPNRIQAEANIYFEKVYSPSNAIPIEEFLNDLKALKSGSPKDKQVLQCMAKNLFEEHRFFKDYPERERSITAELYGGLIRESIISNLYFATAIRKLVESVQAEADSNLWKFGVEALDACKTVLHKFPKVCVMIADNDNFERMPDSLKKFITSGMERQLP